MIGKKLAVFICTVVCAFMLQSELKAQATTFKTGSAIINMGSDNPSVQNSLKPYGLVFSLLKNYNVPVSAIINNAKGKDGIDFVHNGKTYKGGTYIISKEFISTQVANLLTNWANQGVLIDYTSSSLTLDVSYRVAFVPRWTMDRDYGDIAISFLSAAGIPASAYGKKTPDQLGNCDDIFVLPHANPTFDSHKNLYKWNKEQRGPIWAGCHAVSVLENLSGTVELSGVPTAVQMNFLSTNGLVSFENHINAVTPFSSFNPTDPVAQYIGKTDGAQTIGSETVYLPLPGGGWRPGAKLLSTSPNQSDIPSLSPGQAAINIYGRAFDDPTRGYVAYQAAHNIGGTTTDAIAAQRIFFNYSFVALNDKITPILSVNVTGVPDELRSGVSAAITANVTGTAAGNVSYQWKAYINGIAVTNVFSSPNSQTTNFTPDATVNSTNCVITCVVTDNNCTSRIAFDSKGLTVIPGTPPLTANNIFKTMTGGCNVSMPLTFNVMDDNVDPNAGTRTMTTLTGLANGAVLSSTSGQVIFTPNGNFNVGITTGTYTLSNGVTAPQTGNITITVGAAAQAPSVTTDVVNVPINVPTAINVLSNDQNDQNTPGINLLSIRDISSKPTKGYARINVDNTITYLSFSNTTAATTDAFSYRVCNTAGYCSEGNVTINLGLSTITLTNTATQDSYIGSDMGGFGSGFDPAEASVFDNSADGIVLSQNSNQDHTRIPLLQFDLSNVTSVAAGSPLTVTNASLMLTVKEAVTPNDALPGSIFRMNLSWSEASVSFEQRSTGVNWSGNYNFFEFLGQQAFLDQSSSSGNPNFLTALDAPTLTANAAFQQVSGTIGLNQSIFADITEIGKYWVSDITNANNNGIAIFPNATVGTDPSGDIKFYDKSDLIRGPKLIITYQTLMGALTTTAPFAYPDIASTTSSANTISISVLDNDANYFGSGRNELINVVTSGSGTVAISGTNVTYKSNSSFVGVETLTYTVRDNVLLTETTSTVRVTVSQVAPIVVDDAVSTNSFSATTITVGTNDSDPQTGVTLGVPVITEMPKNGTAVVSGNNIIYTPSGAFTGNDQFKYSRAGNSLDVCATAPAGSATVTVTVNNQPPVANPVNISTYACGPVNIKLLQIATDPEGGTLSITTISTPSSGTLAAQPDGSYTYTPDNGFTGVAQFTYQVKDPLNATSLSATVSITVTGAAEPNVAPIAVADTDNTLIGQAVFTNVLANDSDPNNDPLTISITGGGLLTPLTGTLNLLPNKLIKYTPPAGFSGTITYQYRISDTHPSCSGNGSLDAIGTVTINVVAIPTTLSGTVYNDADVSGQPDFTGIKTNTETGTNGNGSLYVYLVDNNIIIKDRTPVDVDGTYMLSNVPSQTSGLKLIVNNEEKAIGAELTASSLPNGYANSSPLIRTLPVTTLADMGPYDWGIYVNPVLIGGTISATGNICGASGIPPVIQSTANASGGSLTATRYKYQWQSSTTDATTGFTDLLAGDSLTSYTATSPIAVTTWYRRTVITKGAGNITIDATVFSNAVTITVNAPPSVSITPTTVTIGTGLTATFTASGANTYAWSPSTNLNATNTATVIAGPLSSTILYTVNGTVSATGCSSTANITVTVINPGQIGSDQDNCGTFTPAALTSITPASGGTITYSWEMSTTSSTSGFATIDAATALTYSPGSITTTTYYRRVATSGGLPFYSNVVTKAVKANPVATAGSNSPICVGTALNLTSSGGTGYSWTGPNGFADNTQNPSISNVTTAASGTYTVTVTGANGCTSTATTIVTVNTAPSVSITPTSIIIGTGFTATLTASGADTYAWTPATHLNATNTATVIAGPLTATTSYTVSGTVSATGCSNTSTITVTVINPGQIGSDQENCGTFTPVALTSAINASGAIGITYAWEQSTASSTSGFATIDAANASTYSPSSITATTYYRRVAKLGGQSFYSNVVTATVKSLPTATANNNSPICVGATLTLSATGGTAYSWTGPNGFASNLQNPSINTVTAAASGTYSVVVTGANGCTSTATTVVTINSLPTVSINPTSASINVGGNVVLTASGANTYSWTPSTGLSANNTSVVTANPGTTTTYNVTGTATATGCTNTTNVTVTVVPDGTLIPGLIGSDMTICSGASASSFTSTTDASGGTGTINYQWQHSTDNTTFTNITSATAATYNAGAVTQTTYYRRGASTSTNTVVYSNTVKITVQQTVAGTISGGGLSVCSGTNSGTLTLTGHTGSVVRWESSTNGFSTAATISNTTNVLSFSNITATTQYRAVVQLSSCSIINTAPITVTTTALPVSGAIAGPCAMTKDSVKTFMVAPVANATSYIWQLPSGWSGTSTTNTIDVKAGVTAGAITVTAVNNGCSGISSTSAISVTIIDHAKITITATPTITSGNLTSTMLVTVQLYDINGNIVNCSGGIATLCSNIPSASFSTVVDHGDGTYTSYLSSPANQINICGTVGGIPLSKTTTVTFTGPQGGIKGNGPILAHETPKVTFTFTAGVAPYTVIYRSAKSNKNDTLTNVISGQPIDVPLIPSTTLYTLVQIIDGNGERRVDNFNRDTATIIVLAPKIVVTLKSDAPVHIGDSTWATRLALHVKNIGDLDLANVQVKLNLKDVFPSPVTYVLDSVRVNGRTIVQNPGYDGVQETDLFAGLMKPGGKLPTSIQNSDPENTGSLVNADGVEVYGNATTNNASEEAGYDRKEHSVYMFGPSSQLPINEDGFMYLYLRIKPNGHYEPFEMQAVALGTGHTAEGSALATSLSNDNENTAAHPEITEKGDPLPTIINLIPVPVLGVSLSASTPADQGNGTYNVTLSYKLRNYGNVNLQSVHLYQNLLRMIGTPAVFTLVGGVTTTGTLLPNPAFNAGLDSNLLLPLSEMGMGEEGTVQFTINIRPNQLSALYRLQAQGAAVYAELNLPATDLSTDGADPDPDGNKTPSEKVLTLIVINQPIPPLVPPGIGINIDPPNRTTVLTKTYCVSAIVHNIPTGVPTGGSGPYEFQWQGSTDNITFTDIAGATDSVYTTGSVTVSTYLRMKVISDNQVAFTNSVHIVIVPLPAKPIITGSATQVVGIGNISLSSSVATTYSWTGGATTRAITATNPGSYSVTITDNNGCSATSDAYVITALDPYKVADIQKRLTKSPELQYDGSFIMNFRVYASNLRTELIDSVRIKDDLTKVFPSTVTFEVLGIQASGSLIANNLYNGNSNIELVANGSQLPGMKSDSVQIIVKVLPNGFSGTLLNTADLTGKSPYGVFKVSSNDPTVSNGVLARSPTPFFIPSVDLVIPSGFTPNRDGTNDQFVITRPYNTSINMEIFNRWGNLVYRNIDYKNDWGGRGNQPNNVLGEELPDGTYYYIILARDKTTGSVKKFAGFITLKR